MSGTRQEQPVVKAVILDYGEVLCHRPTVAQTSRLANFFSVDVERFAPLWERNRGAYDRGDLSSEVYWSMVARDSGATIGARELEEICNLDREMWSNVNSRMVEWALRLGSSGLKVGLLSNMHPEMVTHCRKNFAWLDEFDFVTFSAEVNLIKPDRAIYEHTLRGLGVAPSEALFLDDREVNIRAARSLGIHSIHFQSMEQVRNDLRAAGFSILPADS